MAATLAAENLGAVFKAYDVRGTVPDQLDEELARAIGRAFVQVLGVTEVVVGYDMRPTSPGLAGAFADGATMAGADVTMIGLASTDQLYFASGHLGKAGAMFTASHNPAQYNGIKMCRARAVPVGLDSGLAEIRDLVVSGGFATSAREGSISEHDVLEAYAAHLLALAPVAPDPPVRSRPLRVVVDAGNGMAGHTAPAVFGRLGDVVEIVPLYFELDGTFPHHEANPIEPANLVDLQRLVVAEGADIGLAFDGDADRCFLVDETGAAVSPSALTALIAERELAKHPGATVIHNLITSRVVPEVVTDLGGTAVRTRVGHSFIKAQDGRDRRRVRRRAQRPLLLPRLLARRLRDARRPPRARGAGRVRPAAVAAARPLRALPAERRDQLRGRRPGRGARRRRAPLRRAGRRDHRPPRRPHRQSP